jgi:hypothetical protein
MTPAPHLWRGWETPGRSRAGPGAGDIEHGLKSLHIGAADDAHDDFVEEEFTADPAALQVCVQGRWLCLV